MSENCTHIWHTASTVFYEAVGEDVTTPPIVTMICELCGDRKKVDVGTSYSEKKLVETLFMIEKHSDKATDGNT
jgi:hypothetical protein